MNGQLTTVPMGCYLFWPVPMGAGLYRLVPNDKMLMWPEIQQAVGVYAKVRRTTGRKQDSILLWQRITTPHHEVQGNEQRAASSPDRSDPSSD